MHAGGLKALFVRSTRQSGDFVNLHLGAKRPEHCPAILGQGEVRIDFASDFRDDPTIKVKRGHKCDHAGVVRA
jgi:hypothetical protein